MKVFLDSNIFVFLSLDPEEKGKKAEALVKEIISGKIEGYTSSLVIDELMWVLLKNNKGHLLEEVISSIYKIPNCTILPVSSEAPRIALEYMKKYKLKPRDALHLAVMKENDIKNIISDDTHFDRVKEIKRLKLWVQKL